MDKFQAANQLLCKAMNYLKKTFVQKDRFKGTCYRAANWSLVGQTQGRRKLDSDHKRLLPIKDIFIFSLIKSFRKILCSS